MSKYCIVVPVYKPFNLLATNELLSLNRLYKVLCIHSIYIIGPTALNFGAYIDHARTSGTLVKSKTFDECYFSTISGYNRLLLSELFYKKFTQYKFILICQTDAYVFRDELNYWCKKEYDYIGAPWSGMHVYDNELLEGVGNGGFSLRKVKGAIIMLRKLRMLEVLEHYQYFNWKGTVPRLPSILIKLFRSIQKPGNFEKTYNFQEDVFWCKSAPKRLNSFACNATILRLMGRLLIKNDFKIAPVGTAVQFSIETNPQEYYNLNKGQLPFGCHAWGKYDPEFWKAFIPVS